MTQIIIIFIIGILGISKYFSLKEKGYSTLYSTLCLLAGIILIIYAFMDLIKYI